MLTLTADKRANYTWLNIPTDEAQESPKEMEYYLTWNLLLSVY